MEKIISIHIPKTAGTSFRKTLEHVYGRSMLSLYNYGSDQLAPFQEKVPDKIKLIHGHINLNQYHALIEKNPEWKDALFITWVRNPVDRFISNYYYMNQLITDQMKLFPRRPGLQKRMLRSLDEVANQENEHDLLSRYISPKFLAENKYLFIGETEHYSNDLARLATLLNWAKYPLYQVNRTANKKDVDERIKRKIAAGSKKDLTLYKEIISWNNDQKKNSDQLSPKAPEQIIQESKRSLKRSIKIAIRSIVGRFTGI
ncbi:sulfotransferase family 2 domain-containing protein [Ekhidna sp. MALMAid0563]|uniref:sulfotransferase family 2 domain-containing protein n=1 Tax=Ekhidna sp. MALMAid0563 TaxID=3143937 RepID=UPI0032DF190A